METATGPKRRYVYAKTRKEVAEKVRKAMGERDAGMAFDAEGLILSDYLDRWRIVHGYARKGHWLPGTWTGSLRCNYLP